MEEFVESPMLLLQCGIALAVPAVLTAIVNLGCGKKRDQPIRPGGKKDLSKSKPGGVGSSSKSAKSKRSTKSAGSGKKTGKASSSKRSSKSIDKSGKSGKNSKKSSKSSKGSKSSKSKRSKRDVKLQQTGPPSSQRSDAARTAVEADKNSLKHAAHKAADAVEDGKNSLKHKAHKAADAVESEKNSLKHKAHKAADAAEDEKNSLKHKAHKAADAVENTVKSAATQLSQEMSGKSEKTQPSQKTHPLDANGNGMGTTAVVITGIDSTRELKMEPAELRWSSSGGMQKISLLNQSNERQAIKVKCSDNNVYRVNPVYAIVEPGQTLNVDVMRQNGSNKVDKIVFVTTRAGQEENPKNLFKAGAQSSLMVLPLLATDPAATN